MIRTFLLYILPFKLVELLTFGYCEKTNINKPEEYTWVEIDKNTVIGKLK